MHLPMGFFFALLLFGDQLDIKTIVRQFGTNVGNKYKPRSAISLLTSADKFAEDSAGTNVSGDDFNQGFL